MLLKAISQMTEEYKIGEPPQKLLWSLTSKADGLSLAAEKDVKEIAYGEEMRLGFPETKSESVGFGRMFSIRNVGGFSGAVWISPETAPVAGKVRGEWLKNKHTNRSDDLRIGLRFGSLHLLGLSSAGALELLAELDEVDGNHGVHNDDEDERGDEG